MNRMTVMLVSFAFLGVLAFSQEKEMKKTTEPKTEKKVTMNADDHIVVMETTMGTIELKLYPDKAPKTVENFEGLVKKGYYNGIIFHRVIDKFMIQGGDPTGTGMGGESIWKKPFEDEFHPSLKFDRKGLLAMANAGPNTNGSQFFITLVPTPWLNNRHTIFGEVVKGMEVVESIGKVPTKKPGDKPVTDVVMKNVYLKGGEKSSKEKKKEQK
jgi:cyclophilin family peptidyl-prolyl cis-trans isomerase